MEPEEAYREVVKIYPFALNTACVATLRTPCDTSTSDRFLVITSPSTTQIRFLDPTNLSAGLHEMHLAGWKFHSIRGSVILLTRGVDEVLLWLVDMCTGVRFYLLLHELSDAKECNGAVFLTFDAKQARAPIKQSIYVIPLPVVQDDTSTRQLPNQVPDTLPLVEARLVYKCASPTARLVGPNKPFGSTARSPYFYCFADLSVWVVSPEAK